MINDRIKSGDADKKIPKPEISIIKNGDSIYKPGMKTYFVETKEGKESDSSGVLQTGKMKTITETVCICDRVCTCNPQCSCQGNCSCNKVCSCQSNRITSCTCNKVCTCNPVH